MFGIPDVSTASSFRQHVDVANALAVATLHCPFRNAFAADRADLVSSRCEDIAAEEIICCRMAISQTRSKCPHQSFLRIYGAKRA